MEIHLPGHIRTLRDFFVHLGIITLGILIALGLEQIVEAHHRAKIGRETVVSFRAELAYDRQQVIEVMAATAGLRGQLQRQIQAIEAVHDPAAKGPIPIAYPQIHFDYIASASWETAIATQALYYIPASRPSASARPTACSGCSWTRNAADFPPGRTCGALEPMPPHLRQKSGAPWLSSCAATKASPT